MQASLAGPPGLLPRRCTPVIPPCGNCRQLLWDYAPKAAVLLDQDGTLVKVGIGDLMPLAYRNFYDT